MLSVNLDRSKYPPCEPQATHEPSRSGDQEDDHTNHEHVPEEQQVGQDQAAGLEFLKPEATVAKDVKRRAATGEETPPPPVVVLGAQVEVAQKHRELSARHHQNQKDQERKSEHVVVLIHPDAAHDEEELHEGCSEGQDSTQKTEGGGGKVPRLFGDLPGDRARDRWIAKCIVFIAEEGSEED